MTDSALPPPALGPAAVAAPTSDPVTRAVRAFWRTGRTTAGPAVLIACGAAGLASGVLVVGHDPGLGLSLAWLLLWLPAVPAMVRRRAVWDLVLAATSVALAAVAAVRDADWVVGLAVVSAVLASLVAATGSRTVAGMLLSPVTVGLAGLRSLPWVAGGVRHGLGARRAVVAAVVRTAFVSALLLLVFGVLFATADVVFASYLPTVDLADAPAQVVVGLLLAVAAAALAHLALAPASWAGLSTPRPRPVRQVEWLVPLVALVALVWAFVLVQVGGLVSGHEHVLETAGLTYAEYARQGFAQLVAVTALTLVVVAVAARRAPRGTAAQSAVSRLVLGALCLGTAGVVATALRRMDLYVEAFGLTRLRLLVVAVEIGLGVLLVVVAAAGVRWRGGWLPRAVVVVGATTVLGLAAVNPDAQIARHNADLAMSSDAGADWWYLTGLSDDALPTIATFEEPLRSCVLASTASDGVDDGVGGWNLGRSRAADVRAGLPESVTSPSC